VDQATEIIERAMD
jgi:DNA segregation ATPase FtsK/SpoIIIE, S-DNA-T family